MPESLHLPFMAAHAVNKTELKSFSTTVFLEKIAL